MQPQGLLTFSFSFELQFLPKSSKRSFFRKAKRCESLGAASTADDSDIFQRARRFL